ncbi:MAG: hypothetical protein Q8K82_00420 [Gemmatimonadaceae bacterium]|nr:hypothetical protein [Gemmatimonadaceae bacterium]
MSDDLRVLPARPQPVAPTNLPKYLVPLRSPFVLTALDAISLAMGNVSCLVFMPSALPICSTEWPSCALM